MPSRSSLVALPLAWASLVLAACGGGATPPPATPAAPAADDSSFATGETPAEKETAAGIAASAPEPTAAQRRPLDITSECPEIVTVAYADDPKDPKAGTRTLAQGTTEAAPRRGDGTQTVWLLDAQGEGLVKVSVTRGMRHIVVGRSCRTLDAR